MLHTHKEVIMGNRTFKEKSKSCNVRTELCAFARHNHQMRKTGKPDLYGWIHISQTLPDVGLTEKALKIVMSTSLSPEF